MCADGGSKCRPLLRPAMISISKRSSPPKKLRGVPDLRLLLVKSLEPFEPLLEPVASLLLSAPRVRTVGFDWNTSTCYRALDIVAFRPIGKASGWSGLKPQR